MPAPSPATAGGPYAGTPPPASDERQYAASPGPSSPLTAPSRPHAHTSPQVAEAQPRSTLRRVPHTLHDPGGRIARSPPARLPSPQKPVAASHTRHGTVVPSWSRASAQLHADQATHAAEAFRDSRILALASLFQRL